MFAFLPTAMSARKDVPHDPSKGDMGQGGLAKTGKGAGHRIEYWLPVLERSWELPAYRL